MENKCCICSSVNTKLWINPSNPKDRNYYCNEHFSSISKAFGKLTEIILADKAGILDHILERT